jgi:hypothetical protein
MAPGCFRKTPAHPQDVKNRAAPAALFFCLMPDLLTGGSTLKRLADSRLRQMPAEAVTTGRLLRHRQPLLSFLTQD